MATAARTRRSSRSARPLPARLARGALGPRRRDQVLPLPQRPGATSNWFQTLGSATLTAFLVQAITGVILAMYYKPDPTTAYASIQYITNDLTLGWLVRGMHRWGACVFIILMFLHMGRVFLFGAYKYPRELNWIIGVLLLDDRPGRGLHRLPAAVGPDGVLGDDRRDQHQRHGAVPRARSSRSSSRAAPRSAPTRSRRFYAIHMLVLPGAIVGLIGAAPLPRDPPRRHLAAVVEGRRRARCRARRAGAGRRGLAAPARGEATPVSLPATERRAPRTSSATRRTSRNAGSRSSPTRCSTTR